MARVVSTEYLFQLGFVLVVPVLLVRSKETAVTPFETARFPYVCPFQEVFHFSCVLSKLILLVFTLWNVVDSWMLVCRVMSHGWGSLSIFYGVAPVREYF